LADGHLRQKGGDDRGQYGFFQSVFLSNYAELLRCGFDRGRLACQNQAVSVSRQVRGALAVAIPLSTTSVVKNTAALARGRGGLVAPCIVPQSVATRGLLAQNERLIPGARVVDRASCLLLKLAGASASAFLSRVLRWQGFKIATGSAHV
jgi:hypothetical protein